MTDLILEEFDLKITNGDFTIETSDVQQQGLILVCDKGDFKEYPTSCVGVGRWLKDDDPEGMLAEVKKEFERDGMKVKAVAIEEPGNLITDAHY